MRIRTIHPRLIVDRTEYVFQPTESIYFEGDVPDEVGHKMMKAKRRPDEFVVILSPKEPSIEESKPELEPEVELEIKTPNRKPKGK